jgi:hypothetical protein
MGEGEEEFACSIAFHLQNDAAIYECREGDQVTLPDVQIAIRRD